MAQAKNEANVQAIAEAGIVIQENKPNLPYREDQWSPFNTNGKKVYNRDFLLALRKDPKSNEKPANLLPNIDRGLIAPSKSSSQRGGPPKRKSQQRSIGGNKSGKQNVIRVSVSVKEDVKLHETEKLG